MERSDTGSAEAAAAGFADTAAPLRATVVFFAVAEAAAFFAEPVDPVSPVVLVFASFTAAFFGAVAVRAEVAPAAEAFVVTSVFPTVFRDRCSAMMGNPHMQNGRAAGAAHSE